MPDVDTAQETKTAPFLERSEVEKRAKEVREEHNLTTIPIDPVLLANRLGVKVLNAKFWDDNLVGTIEKRGDDMRILVKQSDPPSRKRFTIAHELGHLFLHLADDGEYLDKEANLFRLRDGDDTTIQNRSQEIQANMFASSLLMPEEEVRRYWAERPSIRELARIFRVSNAAMGYRVASLGLE